MNNECSGLMGLWFGHKFEARYDEETTDPKDFPSNVNVPVWVNPAEIILANKDKTTTYVGDICVRCGTTVERVRFNQPFPATT